MITHFAANNGPRSRFGPETPLERAITDAPDWLAGLEWGRPRPGHPEGTVSVHIGDVLRNIDRFYHRSADRAALRLIALVHDTFKYQTDQQRELGTQQSHGFRARLFAETYIDDPAILQVIECHDDAYKIWRRMVETGNSTLAEMEARALIARLGDELALFMRFYQCDNRTAGKSTAHYLWFKRFAVQHLYF